MSLLIERCALWPEGAGSIMVENGVIKRLSGDDTQPVPGGTRSVDAGGATVLPGLADSHCHPFEFGWLRRSVDLRGTSNITGLRLRLSAGLKRAAPGDWVVGRGWDHEAFAERRMPRRTDIDDLSPENPVILSRVCGHVGLLNTRAMESLQLAGREGAEYERDESGSLTGILKEAALADAYARMPGRSAPQCMSDLLSAEVEAVRQGLTAMHTIVSEEEFKEELEALLVLNRDCRLSIRHRVYIPPKALEHVAERGIRSKLDGPSVRVNGVKLYADGSLGAGTAALSEPYSDDPTNTGILRYGDEELSTLVDAAASEGYQVIVHAIGDRAIEQAIGALARVTGGGNPARHRIEHASLLPKSLRAKIRKHSIRLAVQPCFITSDTWAAKRLGEERVNDLYPLRSIVAEGIVASGGSDAPVETLSPIIGAWAAMVRSGFAPDEKLTLGEAVSLYTTHSATNGLDEDAKVEVGSRADLTVLDSNIEGMHPALLRKVGVAATIVGGRVVHSNRGAED